MSCEVSRARSAVGKLCVALTDAKEFIRQQAAEALGRIGPAARKAVPALTQALADPVKYVRWQAAVALGHIGPAAAKAVPALLERLQDYLHYQYKMHRLFCLQILVQLRLLVLFGLKVLF